MQAILYTFRRCPWAMRARLALCYMDIPFETREVNLKNKPQSFLNYSPKGTVPVLITPNGEILEESLDIILYAMKPSKASYSLEQQKLIAINDTEFKTNVSAYKYPERAGSPGQEESRQKCESFLAILEAKLVVNKYLVDSKPSIADIAIFPLVRQFTKVDLDWFAQAPYPNIRRWLELITASEYFAKAMEKFSVWTDKP